jgi:hypothetical protein
MHRSYFCISLQPEYFSELRHWKTFTLQKKMNLINISARLDGARNTKISPSIRFLCNTGEEGVATGTKSRHYYLFSATLSSHGLVRLTSKYIF